MNHFLISCSFCIYLNQYSRPMINYLNTRRFNLACDMLSTYLGSKNVASLSIHYTSNDLKDYLRLSNVDEMNN